MDYIEYGKLWKLSRDNIKSASVYEEIDATSATLSINTASIEIVDAAKRHVLRPLRREYRLAAVQDELVQLHRSIVLHPDILQEQ